MLLFKQLTADEARTYRQWARTHYKLLTPIPGIWHPVVQAECTRMNREAQGFDNGYFPEEKSEN